MSKTLEVGIHLTIDLDSLEVVGKIVPVQHSGSETIVCDIKPNKNPHLLLTDLLVSWDMIKAYVKKDLDMTNLTYKTWIEPLEISRIENKVIYLKKVIDGAEEYIEKRYFLYLRGAIMTLYGENYLIKFEDN